jgi:hypothetical protein
MPRIDQTFVRDPDFVEEARLYRQPRVNVVLASRVIIPQSG